MQDASHRCEIVALGRRHIAGFHEVLDAVAREGRYLAMLEAPPMPQVRRFVLNNLRSGAAQFVALDGEQVVGWCDVTAKPRPSLRHSGVLGMGLAAPYRGQRLGSRLLAVTVETAVARGMTRIELTVRTDNAAAIALYRHFGFETEGLLRHYLIVGGSYHDALLMARI